ncbi:MAG: InlB B-repeat-containing protein [Treponema sp.]|jgi:hypothetical protein|nr:InlB B-repeat-containing protein [Treponema sp.]
MKHKSALTGILSLTLVLSIVLPGCDTGTNGGENTSKTYIVSFDPGEGSGTPPVDIEAKEGTSITLPGPENLIAPGGQVFTGWNTNSSGTGTTYPAGSSFTPAADITLYARWNANLTVPSAPSISSIDLTTNGRGLRISWSGVSGATKYKIYWSSAKYGSYSYMAETPATTTIYDDMVVNLTTVGNAYFYQIVASNSAGDSSPSVGRGITVPNPIVYATGIAGSGTTYYRGCRVIINEVTSSRYSSGRYGSGAATTSPEKEVAPGTWSYTTALYRVSQTGYGEGWTGTKSGTATLKPFYKYRFIASTGSYTETLNPLVVE